MRCTQAVLMIPCVALSLEARVQAGYFCTTLTPLNSKDRPRPLMTTSSMAHEIARAEVMAGPRVCPGRRAPGERGASAPCPIEKTGADTPPFAAFGTDSDLDAVSGWTRSDLGARLPDGLPSVR
jgi:hypothetical protein